ncbi:DNA primase [Methylacidimicrobium sp. AP8]|uniref:DNA primase n=1 Tax=Methylacidimicrobium sp. AP8 TaxID=2730359 RepID=UPI0018C11CEB|nr:DNA primase [Methylacidimicrobium sp. AP8]CAB4243339.1 DNA primase [Methylacidimicrobium sp. AP8]
MGTPAFRDFVETVRAASDIVEIIGSYVPLKRAGSKYKALSPFNPERTPSFFVDPQKQLFKCFSSGHGGTVFDFVMRYERLDFLGALRLLAERAGIEMPAGFRKETESPSSRERLLSLHKAVADWWRTILWKEAEGEAGRRYLASRAVPREIAEAFGIGYAPNRWDGVLRWGAAQGYPVELLAEAGLVVLGEKGRPYDRFRDRLILPIADEGGRIVGFSGRIVGGDGSGPKYLNSPETPIFTKGKVLFGMDRAKRAILQEGRAVLCEGPMDLIRCHAVGFSHVVAVQGTALTEHHARLLRRFTEEVIVCFDADRAGENAAVRGIEILTEAGLEVRVASLPAGEDPDSFLCGGEAAVSRFREILQRAPTYLSHLLEQAASRNDLSLPRGRSRAVQSIAPWLAKVSDPIRREALALEAAVRLGVSRGALEQAMRKADMPSQGGRSPSVPLRAKRDAVLTELIWLLCEAPGIQGRVRMELDLRWLEENEEGGLVQKILSAGSDPEALFPALSEEERSLVTGLLVSPPPVDPSIEPEERWSQLRERLAYLWKQRRIRLLEERVRAGGSSAEIQCALRELVDLRRSLE